MMEKASASTFMLARHEHSSGRGVSQNWLSSAVVHLNSGPYSRTQCGPEVVVVVRCSGGGEVRRRWCV